MLSAGLLITMYFVNALGEVVEALEPLQPFTLFHYYGSAIVNGVAWPSFAAIILLAAAFALLAAFTFERRDIYT